ncbi:divalent-cation tolerance protein CutA [Candidatus Gottesmanbacteria bacterium]|nr:divalent-cation tolerance protein CutA [Candidatus Gottesmanbacteria bacterium]
MIVVIVTCKDKEEATKIAKRLLEKKLVACAKVLPAAHSLYLWPPKSGKIKEADEIMLIAKTLESKWETIEKEVLSLHSYKNPEIYAVPVSHVSKKYLNWVSGELRKSKKARAYESMWKILEKPTKGKPMGASEEDKAIYDI